MKYRQDIDGLRSLAVGSVLLYHFQVPFITGGFIGVDIFFVISGFLISSIILDNLEAGQFSVIDFYERRARRILPALAAMLVVTLIVGALLLFPQDFEVLTKSAISSLLFFANFFFWGHSGYFNTDAELQPLLHTWSLSVEEQFYIFFPVLLLVGFKFLKTGVVVILFYVMFVSSFVLSVYMSVHTPTAGFYFPVGRAWELMLGAIVARPKLFFPRLQTPSSLAAEMFSYLGLGLILLPIFILNKDSIFPGVNALWPVLGTILLIWAGANYKTQVSRALSLKPFVFLGLISYSLYLWHWPIWVFADLLAPGIRALFWVKGVLVVLSVLLAWLSWRFVEAPFRSRNNFDRRAIFTLSGGVGGGLVLVAIMGAFWPAVFTRIELSPMQATVLQYEYYRDNTVIPRAECFLGKNSNSDATQCNKSSRESGVLIWGDSYAEHLVPGLLEVQPRDDLVQVTSGGCPPFLYKNGGGRGPCVKFSHKAQKWIEGVAPRTVILAARWNLYSTGRWGIVLDRELSSTLRFLKSIGVKRVYVVGELPTWHTAFPREVIASEVPLDNNGQGHLSLTDSGYDSGLDARVKTISGEFDAVFLPLVDLRCPAGDCPIWASNGELFQWDKGHLSVGGSIDIVGLARTQFFD